MFLCISNDLRLKMEKEVKPALRQQARKTKEKRTSVNNPHENKYYRDPQQQKHRLNLVRKGHHGHITARAPDPSFLRHMAASENHILQQKLPATTPLLNSHVVGRVLMYLSLFLVPFGTIILIAGMRAKDLRFPYGEECKSSRNYLRILRRSCIFCSGGLNPSCTKEIEITESMRTPVFLYYEIENFYQNHRYLIRSVDNYQLRGKIFTEPEPQKVILKTNTEPFVPVAPSTSCGQYYRNDSEGRFYFPCGNMANAMFSDDFTIHTAHGYKVPLRSRHIAQPFLKRYNYKNPDEITPHNYNYKPLFSKYFVKPRDWTLEVWDEWWKNGGLENERFMNWMVPSHSSTVRKLYAVIDSVPHCADGVFCKGNYTVNINYRYDVDSFKGNKAIILSVPSFLGAPNLFIPIFLILLGLTTAFLGFRLDRMHELCEIVRRTKKRANRQAYLGKQEFNTRGAHGEGKAAKNSNWPSAAQKTMNVIYAKNALQGKGKGSKLSASESEYSVSATSTASDIDGPSDSKSKPVPSESNVASATQQRERRRPNKKKAGTGTTTNAESDYSVSSTANANDTEEPPSSSKSEPLQTEPQIEGTSGRRRVRQPDGTKVATTSKEESANPVSEKDINDPLESIKDESVKDESEVVGATPQKRRKPKKKKAEAATNDESLYTVSGSDAADEPLPNESEVVGTTQQNEHQPEVEKVETSTKEEADKLASSAPTNIDEAEPSNSSRSEPVQNEPELADATPEQPASDKENVDGTTTNDGSDYPMPGSSTVDDRAEPPTSSENKSLQNETEVVGGPVSDIAGQSDSSKSEQAQNGSPPSPMEGATSGEPAEEKVGATTFYAYSAPDTSAVNKNAEQSSSGKSKPTGKQSDVVDTTPEPVEKKTGTTAKDESEAPVMSGTKETSSSSKTKPVQNEPQVIGATGKPQRKPSDTNVGTISNDANSSPGKTKPIASESEVVGAAKAKRRQRPPVEEKVGTTSNDAVSNSGKTDPIPNEREVTGAPIRRRRQPDEKKFGTTAKDDTVSVASAISNIARPSSPNKSKQYPSESEMAGPIRRRRLQQKEEEVGTAINDASSIVSKKKPAQSESEVAVAGATQPRRRQPNEKKSGITATNAPEDSLSVSSTVRDSDGLSISSKSKPIRRAPQGTDDGTSIRSMSAKNQGQEAEESGAQPRPKIKKAAMSNVKVKDEDGRSTTESVSAGPATQSPGQAKGPRVTQLEKLREMRKKDGQDDTSKNQKQ